MNNGAFLGGLLALTIAVTLTGCEMTAPQQSRFLDERIQLAQSLENQERLAEALFQWRVLAEVYSDNEFVQQKYRNLEQKIDQKLVKLRGHLSGRESLSINPGNKKIYLKMLALQPDNKEAREALRQLEKGKVELAATLKTEKIQSLFYSNQQKAKKEIDLARYNEQVQDLLESGKYVSLIQLTDRFLSEYPQHQPAHQVKYNALIGLANDHLKAGHKEKAINYYEKAQLVSDLNAPSLTKKITTLRRQLSSDLYVQGMKVFTTNIDKAVILLQKSVEINPSNFKAKQQLTRATKIQENLQRIKQAS